MTTLLDLAEPWGYLVIAVLAAAEASAFVGLVIPGEAAMLLGGFLAYQGRASLTLMIIAGCIGAIAGDSIGYEIGRHLGPRLRSGRLGRKIGQERWDRATAYVRRRGGRAVFLGRFVGVLRALVPAVAGSAGMPYRAFLPFNVAGGVIWASAFIALGYVFGGSWKVVERWAGRASLVLLLLLGLAAGISIGARWVRDHADELSTRWQRLLTHPRVLKLRRRYQVQIGFLMRRVDRRSAMGLRLTVALFLVVGATWAFGALLEDVLSKNELALVDRPTLEFMSSHRAPSVTEVLRQVARIGDPRVALSGLAFLAAVAWLRERAWSNVRLLILILMGVGVPFLVAALVSRLGPPGGLVPRATSSFPSVPVTAATLLVLGIATIASHRRRWSIKVWTFGAAIFVASSVALARVYLGADWVTDGAAGFALALAWFAVSHSVAIPASRDERFQLGREKESRTRP